MSLILSIETSTALCSVALHRSGVLVDTRESIEEGAHAKQLTLLIEALLTSQEISGKDLDAIAISLGPGSYTGLRIGLIDPAFGSRQANVRTSALTAGSRNLLQALGVREQRRGQGLVQLDGDTLVSAGSREAARACGWGTRSA